MFCSSPSVRFFVCDVGTGGTENHNLPHDLRERGLFQQGSVSATGDPGARAEGGGLARKDGAEATDRGKPPRGGASSGGRISNVILRVTTPNPPHRSLS